MWTEQKVRTVVDECRKAGKEAAEKTLQEYEERTGKPRTYIHPVYGRCATMFDRCGFASIHLDAKQGFYRAAKTIAQNQSLRFSCGKGYPKGGRFSVYDMSYRQEISINVAAANAVAEVLRAHGIKGVYVTSRLD